MADDIGEIFAAKDSGANKERSNGKEQPRVWCACVCVALKSAS